jgi:hypothetical protein
MAGDRDVRLSAILDWLEHGRITTEQAAARVRGMTFGVPEGKTVHARQQADVNGDPEPPVPGSFFAVSDAFAAGRIDQDQYAALAKAAAEAMKRVPGA